MSLRIIDTKEQAMEFHQCILSNGIPAIIVPTSNHLPFAIQVTVSGPRAELENEHGRAHCLEHMLFGGGGEKFPSAQSVENEMWTLGREVEAFTTKEIIVYYGIVEPSSAKRLITLFSEMFKFAAIHSDDFEKERGVILQELGDIIDDPYRFLPSVFQSLLFGDNPLGRQILGSKDSINRFSAQDLRSYKERLCGPPNLTIAAAGALNVLEIETILEERFTPLPLKEQAKYYPYKPLPSRNPALFIPRKGGDRTHIVVGGIGPSYKDPDACAFELLHVLLNYRIWIKARVERSLNYDINASVFTYSDVGLFAAHAATDSTKKSITEVLKIILEEMADIKSGRISDEEITRAGDYMGGSLCLEQNGAEMIAHFFGKQWAQHGRIKTMEEQREEISRVTKADVVRLAQKLWGEENVCSILLTNAFPRYEKEFCKLRSILR